MDAVDPWRSLGMRCEYYRAGSILESPISGAWKKVLVALEPAFSRKTKQNQVGVLLNHKIQTLLVLVLWNHRAHLGFHADFLAARPEA